MSDLIDANGNNRRLEKEMTENIENQLEETAASETLRPNSMPADRMTRANMIASMVNHMSGMSKTDMIDFFNKSMAEFGPNADLGVPDGTAEDNLSTVTPKFSVNEDVMELFSGEEISEDFKRKITTLIESAINIKYQSVYTQLKEEQEAEFNELVESYKEELMEQVDEYLSYVVEQWIEENKVEISKSIKLDIQDSFMEGLRNLFIEHYINVPDEKYDLIGDMETQIESLKESINDIKHENIKLHSIKEDLQKELIVKDLSSNLTESQTLKLNALISDITYDNLETYKEKVQIIKESVFSKKDTTIIEQEEIMGIQDLNEEEKDEDVIDPMMSKYINTAKRLSPNNVKIF